MPGFAMRVGSLAFCLVGGLGAGEDSRVPQDLQSLLNVKVVSATRTQQRLWDVPAAITCVTDKEIRAMGARTLSDVLKRLPGVQVLTRRNGRDMVWIRGVTTDYNTNVLLLVDGIPQREAVYGEWSPDEEIPLNNVERVEVIRGPGSALYGGNAYAGIISIFTKKAYQDVFDGHLGLDALGGVRFGFMASHPTETGGFSVAGSTLRSRGQEMERDRSGLPTDHRDHVESKIIQLKGEWAHATLALSHKDFTTDYPLYATGETKPQNAKTTSASLDYSDKWGQVAVSQKLFFLHVAHFHDYRRHSPATGALQKLLTRDLESLLLGLEGQFNWKPTAGHELTAGFVAESLQAQKYLEQEMVSPFAGWVPSSWLDSDHTGIPGSHPARTFNYALYAQSEFKAWSDRIGLTLGLRHDHNQGFGSALSPRFGLVLNTDPNGVVKLLWGRAFKPPTFRQTVMYRNDGLSPGNPSVGPERIRTLDLQMTRQVGAHTYLQLGYFDQKLSDFIESLSYEPYRNSAGLRFIRGLELEGRFTGRTDWSWPTALNLDVNITRLLKAYDEAPPDLHRDIPGVAPWQWNLALQLSGAHVDLFLGVNALGRRNASDTYHSLVSPQVPEYRAKDNKAGYRILDANLAIHHFLDLPLRIELGIQNLLDTRHYNPDTDPDGYYDYTREPRNVSLKVGVRF